MEDLEHRAQAGDAVAQVALAEQLDARGEHAPAIDWLARAAGADHPPALRLLGIRLSTGRNAPGLPVQGADLIRQAAKLGDAEASALLAVFSAVGYLQPADWAQALAYLRTAAAQNGARAAAQLDLLAAGPATGAGEIDLDAWRSVPDGRILSTSPRIVSFDRLVPAAVCESLIATNRDRLVRAKVFDPISGASIVEKTRTNRVAAISLFETDLLHLAVQSRLAAAAGAPLQTLEASSVLNYRLGEEALPHFDFIDPAAPSYAAEVRQLGQRIATVLLYLNDDYEGGGTVFPELGIDHRGKQGDALLFFSLDEQGNPDRRTVHAGQPPLTGEKWVLSQFIRNRAQM
jgi:prolyl 4-hydroxylase